MAAIVQFLFFLILAASCFAAPGHSGERARRHHDGGLGGFGGYPGFGHQGGHGYGGYPGGGHFGGSQSFSKSSASASSSSQGGSGSFHG